jgi:hypothetical protein
LSKNKKFKKKSKPTFLSLILFVLFFLPISLEEYLRNTTPSVSKPTKMPPLPDQNNAGAGELNMFVVVVIAFFSLNWYLFII